MVYFLINSFINFNKNYKLNLIFIFRAILQIYFYVYRFEYELCTSHNLQINTLPLYLSILKRISFSDMKILENLKNFGSKLPLKLKCFFELSHDRLPAL